MAPPSAATISVAAGSRETTRILLLAEPYPVQAEPEQREHDQGHEVRGDEPAQLVI
jgi:hypothetical protein